MTLSDREAGELTANVNNLTTTLASVHSATKSIETSVDAVGLRVASLEAELAALRAKVWIMGIALPALVSIITALTVIDLTR